MKKLIFISLSILIISFLGSCRKNDNPTPNVEDDTVKGRIIQVYTTIPVPNATVYLYETVWSSSGGVLGGGANTVSLDTAITNDKGEYSFTYKRRRGGNEYFIRAFAENFDEKPGNFYITEKNSNMDVPVFPYAWIKFRIINVPPINNSDYILIGGWIGDSYVKSGKCDTSFIKRASIGNAKNSLYKYQNNDKGDLIFTRLDSIYCKGLDTTYHTIAY
jgi:hypothetical protein